MKGLDQKSVWLRALAVIALLTLTTAVFADDANFGSVASHVTKTMGNIAKLITSGCYVAGLAFAVGAILKFKAHKDQPQQIPIGTPFALLFVAAALIFMPGVFRAAGSTLFGTSASKDMGNVTGLDNLSGS